MKPPRPDTLRLLTAGTLAASRSGWPRPPFGLASWSDEAAAAALLLDATDVDLRDPAQLASQIPLASEFPAATPLFVLGAAVGRRAFLSLLGMRAVPVARAARCTALVARGYVSVGAAVDEASGADLAWGFSSPC